MSGCRASEISLRERTGAPRRRGGRGIRVIVSGGGPRHPLPILAEALGAIAVLMVATVDYTPRPASNSGQPIGKFQVLQHRMVDMFIAEQQAQSAA